MRNGGHGASDEFKLSHRHPPSILPSCLPIRAAGSKEEIELGSIIISPGLDGI